jgi:hypothetical protein
MVDERLEKLGLYFTHFDIRERYNITFEQFVSMVENGRWSDIMTTPELLKRATSESFYETKGLIVDATV